MRASAEARPRPSVEPVMKIRAMVVILPPPAALTRRAQRPRALVDQPQLPGALHGRGPVTDLKLGVDAADMRADRVRRDGQLAGDLGPGQVGGQIAQHPQLARAELLD